MAMPEFLIPDLNDFVPAEGSRKVIVMYKERVQKKHLDVLQQKGALLKYRYNIIPAVTAFLDEKGISELESDPNIVGVYEDMEVHTFLDESVPQIRANEVHSLGVDGTGTKVCIVDTGVDDSHADLASLIAEYDFVNNDGSAYDDNGHGTHVAGIVASRDTRYRGVAYGASLMAAKVLSRYGSGYASNVIAGIEWCAANGADIINMSLGGGAFLGTCDDEPMSRTINEVASQGLTVVVASGNDGRSNRISAPACASRAIAIGAVDKSDNDAPYSNGGSELDVVAPGTGITSTYPGNRLAILTGTSMATPHAAGVAALILEANSELSPSQVQTILRNTAVDLGSAGFDYAYGYGRIDAKSAVDAASGSPGDGDGDDDGMIVDELFFDDFQSGFSKWTESNEFNWNIERAAERGVPGSPSSNTVAHADKCSSSAGCILTQKDPIDLSLYDSAELRFHRYVDRSLDSGEFLKVEVFDGSSWIEIATWTNRSGDDDRWHEETFDLTNVVGFAGLDNLNDFKVRFTSRESSSIEDTEIDNVRITGTRPLETGPTANAGEDVTVSDPDSSGFENIVLDASGSSDSDGTIVSYKWEEGTKLLSTSETASLDFAVGSHTLTLTVTDNDGKTDSDTKEITVIPNQPPVSNAGPDQLVGDGDGDGSEDVTLNGAASSDLDGEILSYVWSKNEVAIGTGMIITRSFSTGTYMVDLTVMDNGGVSDVDSVKITVVENISPNADAGPSQTVTDDGDGSEIITLDGSASVDPDGTIANYEWKENGVVIGSDRIVSVSLGVGEHTIELTVTDNSGADDSDTVVINVQEYVPPPPPPPPPPGPVQVFFDDFQSASIGSSETKWNAAGNWSIRSPKERNISGYPASNLIAHADDCDSECTLTMSNNLDLSGYASAELKMHRYVDRSIDGGEYLKVEGFNGTSWVQLGFWTHRNGDDDKWHQEIITLTQEFLVPNFKIRFSSLESSALEDAEIDDIEVIAKP